MHSLPNSALCIELIFNSNANVVRESDAHSSFCPNCHQIIFTKFNWKVYYPTADEKLVRICQKANSILILDTVNSFDCSRVFKNVDVDR